MKEIDYQKAMIVPDHPPVTDEMSSDVRFQTQIKWRRDKNLSICEDKTIQYLEGQELPKMTYCESSKFQQSWRELN